MSKLDCFEKEHFPRIYKKKKIEEKLELWTTISNWFFGFRLGRNWFGFILRLMEKLAPRQIGMLCHAFGPLGESKKL